MKRGSFAALIGLLPINVLDDLALAKADRIAGYRGRSLEDVVSDMERIVAEAEVEYGKTEV